MEKFEFITEFEIEKKTFKDISSFVSLNTTSPFLETARKKKNKPLETEPAQPEKQKRGKGGAFAKYETEKSEEGTDLKDLTEDKINESLDEITAEDYEDFASLGVDIIDFALDKAFSFMDREVTPNSKEQEKKKNRLKTIVGKLFKKWGLKFSLELLAVVMLIGYGSGKWNKAKVIEPKEKKPKGQIRSITSGKRAKPEVINKDKKEVKNKAKGKGLIHKMQSNE